MSHKNLIDKTVFGLALIGIIVLLNIVALNSFLRIDLTRDGQYTLSEASRDTVAGLEDRMTVKAYFSSNLPPPYSANARYVKDLLDEYYAASNGNLAYEFLDPIAEETEQDKETRKEVRKDVFGRSIRQETEVERELRSLGIQPVEVRVNEGDSVEVKRAYMGISLRYGDQREVLPVVVDTSTLEYDLTSLMRKITRSRVPAIGIITGRDGLDLQQDLSSVTAMLSQQYELEPLDLATSAEIPADVDALIVTGPKQPFTTDELAAMDAFVRSGGAAAFFPDAVKVDLRSTGYEPAEHGLAALLASYGVRIEPGLLLDAECAQISVSQQRGIMRIAQPVRYPFLPLVRQLDQEHPLTRGLADVSFPFVSALEAVLPEDSGAEAELLVRSSDKSWTQDLPLNLNPLQDWAASAVDFSGPHGIVVAVSGLAAGAEGDGQGASGGGRVLVMGGSSLIQNQFLSGGAQALVLNLVDWLLLDEAMLEIRARGLATAPLDELSDTRRSAIKWANIIGVPLLFTVFGLARWRLRERSRNTVTVDQEG